MFTLLRPRTEANQDIGNSFFLKPSILSILEKFLQLIEWNNVCPVI